MDMLRTITAVMALAMPVVTNAAVVEGTARISGGPNTLDLQYSDNTGPVSINESSSINGPGTTGTTLGLVSVTGSDNGFFTLSEFGQGTHENESRFQFTEVITNTAATDQLFSMDFLINAGQLRTTVYETVPQAGEFLEAGYGISISFGGATLFESGALLRQEGGPGDFDTFATLSQSGTSLGGVLTNPQTGAPDTFLYSWDAFAGSLELGLLAAGASGILEYDIVTFGSGIFASCGSGCGATQASIGDPLNVSSIGGPDSITSAPPVAPVPEPEIYAMMLSGIGIMGWVARRRKRKHAAV